MQRFLDSVIDRCLLWAIPKWVRPNHVTFLRFAVTPLVCYLLWSRANLAAAAVIVVGVSTDFMDGAMARTRDQVTDLGKIIDPLADKLLIGAVLVYMASLFSVVWAFVALLAFEALGVLAGAVLKSRRHEVTLGANVFGKVKMVIQSLAALFFLWGLVREDRGVMEVAVYLLFAAALFAVLSMVQVVRAQPSRD